MENFSTVLVIGPKAVSKRDVVKALNLLYKKHTNLRLVVRERTLLASICFQWAGSHNIPVVKAKNLHQVEELHTIGCVSFFLQTPDPIIKRWKTWVPKFNKWRRKRKDNKAPTQSQGSITYTLTKQKPKQSVHTWKAWKELTVEQKNAARSKYHNQGKFVDKEYEIHVDDGSILDRR